MRTLRAYKRFGNWCLALALTALVLSCLALAPGIVIADKPTVEQIREAIKEQGLSWTARGIQHYYWASVYGPGTEYDVAVRATKVSLQAGWNRASYYPARTSRSVATALSSIAGKYTLV